MSLLNVSQVAELLNVSPYTVYGYVSEGKIPVVKLGNLNRFRLEDVEQFIVSNRRDKRDYSDGGQK
ncbi:MAG: helix-turn-helix domain-containing protein [bacterium]